MRTKEPAVTALPGVAAGEPDLRVEEPWSWVTTLRRIVDRHPVWADFVAAIALDALTSIPLVYGERRWWVWLLDQALILPLIVRRKRPYPIFWLISGIAFVQWLANVPL